MVLSSSMRKVTGNLIRQGVVSVSGTRVPSQATRIPAATRGMSSLTRKENVDELLGQSHSNVEYVVSKVDDLGIGREPDLCGL